jgi:hypothetical protein
MTLLELLQVFLPVPLGLSFAVLLGVFMLRPGRCVRPRWARKLFEGLT